MFKGFNGLHIVGESVGLCAYLIDSNQGKYMQAVVEVSIGLQQVCVMQHVATWWTTGAAAAGERQSETKKSR